jgi:hypothetical protein
VSNQQTVAADFEAQTENLVATGFEAKPGEIIDIVFEAKLRNMHYSSPHARCRLHTVSPDLLITRPPSTRPMRPSSILCIKSPTPATILIVARHAAPTTYTPRDKQM